MSKLRTLREKAIDEGMRLFSADEIEDTRIAELESLLKEAADEIESWVEDRYPPYMRNYYSEQRRYDRDMDIVHRIRKALHIDHKTRMKR